MPRRSIRVRRTTGGEEPDEEKDREKVSGTNGRGSGAGDGHSGVGPTGSRSRVGTRIAGRDGRDREARREAVARVPGHSIAEVEFLKKLPSRQSTHIPQVRVAAEVFCGAWTKQRMFHV